LEGMLNKMKEDDGCRMLAVVVEKRIGRGERLKDFGRVLDRIAERDRFKALQMVVLVLDAFGDEEKKKMDALTIEDISSIVLKIPNFSLSTVTAIKPWISDSLDFTKMRTVLESCPDKNCRLEVLAELASASPNTPPILKSADIHAILYLLPQRTAEKGLKIISHLISPDLDIRRVEVIFECMMKTDQVKALAMLLSVCTTRVGEMNEIRAIVEKMDQPLRGLECLKDKLEPNLDFNHIATVLNVIPAIKRVEALQILMEAAPMEINTCRLSAFEMRSVLMLMEASNIMEALRQLLPRFESSSDRDPHNPFYILFYVLHINIGECIFFPLP